MEIEIKIRETFTRLQFQFCLFTSNTQEIVKINLRKVMLKISEI